MARFSQRIGIMPVSTAIQLNEMDEALRNAIWNAIHDIVGQSWLSHHWHIGDAPSQVEATWRQFFKRPAYEAPRPPDAYEELARWFRQAPWHQCYDLLEYVVSIPKHRARAEAIEAANAALQSERSGYRFVAGSLAPISSESERQGVEDAVEAASSSGLHGVASHLRKAVEHFGRRPNPDYANSVKESISAVEGVAKALAGDKATLGAALKRLESSVSIHPALKAGFSSIYGYTSDEKGIRHAMIRDQDVTDEADARYMLISCSAFVHYLTSKATAAGLL